MGWAVNFRFIYIIMVNKLASRTSVSKKVVTMEYFVFHSSSDDTS